MKLSRNDLCNCGSGKKYKKCCITKMKNHNKMSKFFLDRGDQPSGYIECINIPYELSYYQHAKSLYEMIQANSNRDDKMIIVIMSHLCLEAFINRIGTEIVSNCKDNYPLGFDLNESLKNDRFLDKYYKYPEIITGKTFTKSNELWDQLTQLNNERNSLVHAIPRTVDFLEGDKTHEFISNERKLEQHFKIVKRVVEFLLNDLKIPHHPDKINLSVYNFTDDKQRRPPIGSIITNLHE